MFSKLNSLVTSNKSSKRNSTSPQSILKLQSIMRTSPRTSPQTSPQSSPRLSIFSSTKSIASSNSGKHKKYEEPFSYGEIYPEEAKISHIHQPEIPMTPRSISRNINRPLSQMQKNKSEKYKLMTSAGSFSNKMIVTGKNKRERKIKKRTIKNKKSIKT
jgi:hypothetical protein